MQARSYPTLGNLFWMLITRWSWNNVWKSLCYKALCVVFSFFLITYPILHTCIDKLYTALPFITKTLYIFISLFGTTCSLLFSSPHLPLLWVLFLQFFKDFLCHLDEIRCLLAYSAMGTFFIITLHCNYMFNLPLNSLKSGKTSSHAHCYILCTEHRALDIYWIIK